MWAPFQKTANFVQRASSWRYMPFVLCLLSLTDFLIMILPSDAFLIAAILGNQRRAFSFMGGMIGGKMLGVGIVHAVATQIPLEGIFGFVSRYGYEEALQKSQLFFSNHGPIALGLVALTPLPVQAVSLFGSASGARLWKLELCLILGHFVRYLFLYGGIAGGKGIWKRIKVVQPSKN